MRVASSCTVRSPEKGIGLRSIRASGMPRLNPAISTT
jgi:hypothetical protein